MAYFLYATQKEMRMTRLLITTQPKTKNVDFVFLREGITEAVHQFVGSIRRHKKDRKDERYQEKLYRCAHTILGLICPANMVEADVDEVWPEFLEDVCMDCLAETVKAHQCKTGSD